MFYCSIVLLFFQAKEEAEAKARLAISLRFSSVSYFKLRTPNFELLCIPRELLAWGWI